MSEVIVNSTLNIVKAALVLFIVVDPFGNIPIFMSLTEKITKAQRLKVFNTAILVGIILLLVFAFAGQQILSIFGVSLYSFEVAGGILLLIISIKILISGSLVDMSAQGAMGINPETTEPLRLSNTGHPASDSLLLDHASKSHVHALGLEWDDVSGKNNGQHSPFDWRGA